jgi:hypothetical protein
LPFIFLFFSFAFASCKAKAKGKGKRKSPRTKVACYFPLLLPIEKQRQQSKGKATEHRQSKGKS